MDIPSPTICFVGPWQFREFAALRTALDPAASAPHFADLSSFPLSLQKGAGVRVELPTDLHLILVAQPFPGDAVSDQLARIARDLPLTRVVLVAGAWCEGQFRTYPQPPGIIRLYWHELVGWWRAAVSDLQRGALAPWSQPLDSPRAGTLFPPRPVEQQPPRTLALHCRDLESYESLHDSLRSFGWHVIWHNSPPHLTSHASRLNPSAGLFSASQLGAAEQKSLANFAAAIAPAPVITLVDYPRPEHLSSNHPHAAILGKPFQLRMLLDQLAHATDPVL